MERTLALLLLAGLALAPPAWALSVLATVPEWGALAQELGGDKVRVAVATTALQDPHHIEAKPSLIARARTADLVVATGAELEVGWLPLVIQQAGNPAIRPGQPGYFEAAQSVAVLDKPARLDRADGDVHAAGDPHIQTDPRNIALVATALARRMAEVDPANAAHYLAREREFAGRWATAVARWERQAAPLRGVPVVVQHKAFTYLVAWLGLRPVATLEPKPGVEPTTAHLAQVLATLREQPAKMVLRAAYLPDRPAKWISERAGIPVVTLPFTVGGDDEATDLAALFEVTIRRLLKPAA